MDDERSALADIGRMTQEAQTRKYGKHVDPTTDEYQEAFGCK